MTRSSRTLHAQRVPVEVVMALQRFDEEIIEGIHTGPRQFEFPPNMPLSDSAGA